MYESNSDYWQCTAQGHKKHDLYKREPITTLITVSAVYIYTCTSMIQHCCTNRLCIYIHVLLWYNTVVLTDCVYIYMYFYDTTLLY